MDTQTALAIAEVVTGRRIVRTWQATDGVIVLWRRGEHYGTALVNGRGSFKSSRRAKNRSEAEADFSRRGIESGTICANQ